jgi:hypothetical protein
MAFKRSGVRLPLAPPKIKVITVTYCDANCGYVYSKKS